MSYLRACKVAARANAARGAAQRGRAGARGAGRRAHTPYTRAAARPCASARDAPVCSQNEKPNHSSNKKKTMFKTKKIVQVVQSAGARSPSGKVSGQRQVVLLALRALRPRCVCSVGRCESCHTFPFSSADSFAVVKLAFSLLQT